MTQKYVARRIGEIKHSIAILASVESCYRGKHLSLEYLTERESILQRLEMQLTRYELMQGVRS